MITLDEIKYKNIMSIGNESITMQLSGFGKTLITGQNGAGKSTFLEALCFALYGKPFRNINKPLLINTINKKSLEVDLKFHDERHSYRVVRGIKKSVFEIYIDDQLVDPTANTRDYQDILESQILKFNIDTFKQILVLGTAGYIPFMELAPSKRRSVIEDLLDISIFSSMNDINKKEIKTLKSDLNNINNDIDNNSSQLNIHKSYQAQIKSQSTDQIDSLNADLDKEIKDRDKCKSKLKLIADKIDVVTGKMIDDVSDKFQKVNQRVAVANHKITELNSQIDFIKTHDNCPYCNQGISHEHKDHISSEFGNEIESLSENITKLDTTKDKIQKRIDARNKIQSVLNDLNQKSRDIMNQMSGHQHNIDRIKSEINRIESQSKQDDKSKIIAEIQCKLDELQVKKEQLNNDLHCRTVILDLLHDTGVKRLIIKKYIPTLNKLINKYLKLLGGNYLFTVDEEFNEVIKSRGREKFVYNSFSQGEKSRIDLSIMFAFRDLVAIRSNQSCNLLVMDEVLDSANDSSGVENINNILEHLDANVIIISHNEKHLDSDFDRFIMFKKVGNFTKQL